MTDANLEYCCICGGTTGKAGSGDGSLYCCDEGPFCDDCCLSHWDNHEEKIKSLTAKNAELRRIAEHSFIPDPETSDDNCRGCGMNIRHEVHLRSEAI